MNPEWEIRFACLLSACGAIWLSYAATYQFSSFARLLLPPGPVELCALGILAWLHAKYRVVLLERAVVPSEETGNLV